MPSAVETKSSTFMLWMVESVMVKSILCQRSWEETPLTVLRMARTVSFSWERFSLVSEEIERVGKG